MLHSVEVDEPADAVGLLARTAFTREAARWRLEASEARGTLLAALDWHAHVRLRRPRARRSVVARGLLQLQSVNRPGAEALSGQAIARLESELSATKTPAERRRIRLTIKDIRRNPFKVMVPCDQPGRLGAVR